MVNDEGLIADCTAAAQAIAAAADDIQVIFGNLHRKNGVTESRIFLAVNSQLAAVPALGAANYFTSTILPAPAISSTQTISLPIDGKERKVLLLLGDWREQPLPDTDAELAIALSPQPLIIGDD